MKTYIVMYRPFARSHELKIQKVEVEPQSSIEWAVNNLVLRLFQRGRQPKLVAIFEEVQSCQVNQSSQTSAKYTG